MQNVPLSSDYLLGQIKRLPDGSFVAGGQEVTIHGLDVSSGEVCNLKIYFVENGIKVLRTKQHVLFMFQRNLKYDLNCIAQY